MFERDTLSGVATRWLKWKPSSYLSMKWERVGDLTTILVNCDQSHEPLILFSGLLACLKDFYILKILRVYFSLILLKTKSKKSQQNAKK